MKSLYLPRCLVERRWLVPIYRLHTVPMAWECAVCGKLFSLSLPEAEQQTSQRVPWHIEREFRLHSCELHLGWRFPDPRL